MNTRITIHRCVNRDMVEETGCRGSGRILNFRWLTTIHRPVNRDTAGCRGTGRILNFKWSTTIPVSQTTTFVGDLVDGLRGTAEFSL
jgi:hypothetical protein